MAVATSRCVGAEEAAGETSRAKRAVSVGVREVAGNAGNAVSRVLAVETGGETAAAETDSACEEVRTLADTAD